MEGVGRGERKKRERVRREGNAAERKSLQPKIKEFLKVSPRYRRQLAQTYSIISDLSPVLSPLFLSSLTNTFPSTFYFFPPWLLQVTDSFFLLHVICIRIPMPHLLFNFQLGLDWIGLCRYG